MYNEIIPGQDAAFFINPNIHWNCGIPMCKDKEQTFHLTDRAREAGCLTNYYRNYGEKPRHRHDYYEIELCIAGEADHLMDGQTQHLVPGSAVFIPPGTFHQYSNTTPYVDMFSLMYLPGTVFENLGTFLNDCSGCIYYSPRVFQRILSVTGVASNLFYYTDDLSTFQETFCLILKLLKQEYLHRQLDDPEKDPFLQKVEFYILRHLNEQITLGDIAGSVCLDPKYVSAKFSRLKKQTIKNYINQKRIEKAKTLLLTSDLKIISIAAECGFDNLASFNRTFKSQSGCTPRDFRRSMDRST